MICVSRTRRRTARIYHVGVWKGGGAPPSRSGKGKRTKSCVLNIFRRSHCVYIRNTVVMPAKGRAASKPVATTTPSKPAPKPRTQPAATVETPKGGNDSQTTTRKGRGKDVVNWDEAQLRSTVLLPYCLVLGELTRCYDMYSYVGRSGTNQTSWSRWVETDRSSHK